MPENNTDDKDIVVAEEVIADYSKQFENNEHRAKEVWVKRFKRRVTTILRRGK